jgi:hypothetical protein
MTLACNSMGDIRTSQTEQHGVELMFLGTDSAPNFLPATTQTKPQGKVGISNALLLPLVLRERRRQILPPESFDRPEGHEVRQLG